MTSKLAPFRLNTSSRTTHHALPIPYARLSLIALTTLAFALRLLLNRFAFHPDEAIYSSWALHFLRDDPMFLSVWPDKPPIFIWLLAGAFQLFGASEASARWLNIAASTLTVPVVAATGRALWGRPDGHMAGLVAGLALALSPFALSFAPTAFTDTMLVLFGSLSLLMAVRGRAFWAGLWLAAAIMTKQQGILYIPLILAVQSLQLIIKNSPLTIDNFLSKQRLLIDHALPPPSLPPAGGGAVASLIKDRLPPQSGKGWGGVIRFLLGLLLVIIPILYWDSRRWAVAPSPWDLSARNYGALAWLPPAQWGDRVIAWGEWIWYFTASWWVWSLLGMMLLLITLPQNLFPASSKLRKRLPLRQQRNGPLPNLGRAGEGLNVGRSNKFVIPLILWSLAFLALHLTTNVQPWDRYLLPLVPIFALLIGATFSQLRQKSPRLAALLLTALLLAWTPPALGAAQGRLPLGGDRGAWSGVRESLAWVQRESPTDTVIHHDQLGWHLRFYLYDDLTRGDIEARWYPSPVALVDDVAKRPVGQRQFWIAPDWSPQDDLRVHAWMRNVEMETRARFGAFTVYEFSTR